MSNVDLLPEKKSDISAALEYNRQNNWPDVSAKAKVFAHEYSICGDMKSARNKVGISMAVGSRLLRDPLVKGYLDELLEDCRKDSIITREFVELQWLETLEQVNGETEVAGVTRDGEEYMARVYNANGKISALKEMGRVIGMTETKSPGGVSVNIDLSSFTGREEKETAVVIDYPTE